MRDNNKKKKTALARAGHMKPLRQTTLLESAAASSPTRPPKSSNALSPHKSITPGRSKRKHVPESSESSDIGAIKLEPTTPRRTNDEDDHSQSPLPSRTKRRRVIVEDSESDDKEEQESSSSESDAVAKPRRRRLRRLVSKDSSTSRESSPKRHSLSKGKAKQVSSGDEVDKDRMYLPLLVTVVLNE